MAAAQDQPSTSILYVIVPPSPLFSAHWSLFLPDQKSLNERQKRAHDFNNRGRRTHVAGDRLNGFKLEMIRDYDLKKHRGVDSRIYAIGQVPVEYLTEVKDSSPQPLDLQGERKDHEDGGGYVDNIPKDDFDSVCAMVEAPGPSLNSIKRQQ